MFLDLDNFKTVNDALGHPTGDEVLKQFAILLQRDAAPSDRFFRIGGDEFVCLLSRYDEQTLLADAQEILDRTAASVFPLKEMQLRLTASAGLTIVHSQLNPQDALQQADMSLQAIWGRYVGIVSVTQIGSEQCILVSESLRVADFPTESEAIEHARKVGQDWVDRNSPQS